MIRIYHQLCDELNLSLNKNELLKVAREFGLKIKAGASKERNMFDYSSYEFAITVIYWRFDWRIF